MAKVDYYAIAEQIKRVLDNSVPGLTTLIEEPRPAGPDQNPSACVQIRRRSAPESLQSLTAGTQLMMEVDASIIIEAFAMNIRQAIELRDDYIGDVETALMGNRTLYNTVEVTFIDGGELETGRDSSGYYATGEVRLRVRKIATI